MSSTTPPVPLDTADPYLKFINALTKFLNHCKKILEAHKKLYIAEDASEVKSKLYRYMGFLNKNVKDTVTDRTKAIISLHIPIWEELLEDKFMRIIRDPLTLSWLQKKDLKIILGSNKGKITESQVHVSTLFELSQKVEKATEENMLDIDTADDSQELIYSKIFSLYLYEVFLETTNDNKIRESILSCLNEIETDLGVPNPKYQKKSSGFGLEKIMDLAKPIAEKFGVPKDAALPDASNFEEALGKILNSPQAQNIVNDASSSFQNIDPNKPPDMNQIGGLLQGVFGSFAKNMGSDQAQAMGQVLGDISGQAQKINANVQQSLSSPPTSSGAEVEVTKTTEVVTETEPVELEPVDDDEVEFF